jgi:cell surface protein SprA
LGLKLSGFYLLAPLLILSANPVFGQRKDTTRFPISDRRGDAFSIPSRNPFDLRDTSLVKKSIEYDPRTRQYYIVEKIGKTNYRKPAALSFDEFWKLSARQSEAAYFKKRADALTALNQKTFRPPYRVYNNLFDRIFGVGTNGLKVDIKPNGEVNVMAGYQGQNVNNPTLPERARKNGGFDFDMNLKLNVNASIGDKLKFPINYNTLSNLGFDNQLKLDYKGMDDEIIKSLEAGNISFQSRSTLIPSAQNLFGAKAKMQFGKVFITGAIANQRSTRQSVSLQGGAATQNFTKKLDDYEENRHFLLGEYFKNNYNKAMSNLPVIMSQVQVQRIEVWVTNRTGATTDARDIVGLMDLAESKPYNTNIRPLSNSEFPNNGNNDLYASLVNNPSARNPAVINSLLLAKGLRPVEDYEKTFARKLNPSEYYFNPQVGFVSLNVQLQADEVLAVAYQFTYNGRVFQVGEFSQDVALDSTRGVQKELFLKLLKATSQRINLPIWTWMMKNVYSLDLFGSIQQEGFQLNLLYDDPGGGMKRYLPESDPNVMGRPILSVLNLDRLNGRNDPQPDGIFDFVDGYTVLPKQGRIIFPVLEPFGRDLERLAFNGQSTALKKKYVYYALYDSIKAIAQTYANLNRFVMQGQVKGSAGGSEISLNTFNVPPGSVTVTAGGQQLREGTDFIVDYNLGTVKIINPGILSSNVPVSVGFENNAGFGMQQRSFTGLRVDYIANKKFSIGATAVKLAERPFFTKTMYAEDPIRNTMYGLDVSYKTDLPWLTRLLDKLPNYSTKTRSTLNAYGEAAVLKPGHPAQIGSGSQGLSFIDDFEGTKNSIDLRFPMVAWTMASTPQGNPLFPESILSDSINYNFNRAKLAWYNIEPNLQDKNSPGNPLRKNLEELSDPRVRQVYTSELFPQRTTNITDVLTTTFDLAFYPLERGPYNYETRTTEIDVTGRLKKPAARWGGIMRSIDQTDFETGNLEYIEFWTQDPFIKNPSSKGGKMFINLGNVSEDVLKDGKRFYENGMNTPNIPSDVDSSNTWGKTPVNPIQITQAFSNDPGDRVYQDVGFDGLDDDGERRKKGYVLQKLANNFGSGSAIYQKSLQDPASDNYIWYRDAQFDQAGTGILGRYKNYNNQQGNSPIANTGGQFTSAATLFPDNEDLNRDNTLNETEAYYEYEINVKPGMDVGITPYITDKRTVTVNSADGVTRTENWFLFRVPIRGFSRRVGNIPDFKSIRFARLFLTGFEDSVVMRFATLNLVRNQWRQFTYQLDTTGTYTPIVNSAGTTFNTLAVNLEENSARQPVNYIMPPNVERMQLLSNNGVNIQQNEQAMSLQVANLYTGESRAVFKTFTWDIRQFGQLSMYIHAESVKGQRPVRDRELNAVIRIGQDFLNNYYEIKIPLKVTPAGFYVRGQEEQVWPSQNNLDIVLRELINLKMRRNAAGHPLNMIYRNSLDSSKVISILGNPNLGAISGILIGVENPFKPDGPVQHAEIWVNELRLSALNEEGGWAALGRMDITLADLGSITLAASNRSQGFGTIEQRVNERAKDNLFQFDVAANIDAGKLFPKNLRLTLPVYASLNRTVITPQFDPFDLDVRLKDKLSILDKAQQDSLRNAAIEQTTIKTINFTNVRFGSANGRPGLLKLSNFDFNYAYSITEQSSPLIQQNNIARHRGGIGYTYAGSEKFVEPFKKLITNRSPWFSLLRDFNLNLKPSTLSFRSDINRQFGEFIPRVINTPGNTINKVDTTYDKFFTFDRYYRFGWKPARSISLDINAIDNARIDEPNGRIDTRDKKDTVRNNFFKGGRNTIYQQKATLSYTLPLNKFPVTDWIQASYTYGASYNWIGASRLAITQGNIIENSQDNNFNAQFNFISLYNKSKWLRALDNIPPPKPPKDPNQKKQMGPQPAATNALGTEIPTREEVIKGLKGKKKRQALKKWRQMKRDERTAQRMLKAGQPLELNGAERAAGRLLTMVKNVSVTYSENYRSRIPGYLDSTQFLGQNWKSSSPGMDYVFGKQPDTNWLNKKGQQGILTRDSTFNLLFRQNFEQRLGINAQIEPIRDLRIEVNLEKSFSKEYSELFKDTTGNSGLNHLGPLASGGFSISYIGFNTLFENFNPNEISTTFKRFQDYRQVISGRVAEANPYWKALAPGQQYTADGYAKGYGRYSQDVLLPAFIAAYSGADPSKISLIQQSNPTIRANPFGGFLPKPNWRLTYYGLTKIESVSKIFSNVSVTHGYNGNLSMNSYNSALLYRDPFRFNAPGFIDTVSGNFVPFFLVPNITMRESFEPLIGIDLTTNSQMNIRFEYKKSRQLSLSLIDYQLSESRSTEWNFGFSWRKNGIKLPFAIPFTKGSKRLENDVNFRIDLAMRDMAMSNSRLDQSNAYGTGGQKEITIQPSIDYVVNKRVSLKFFFDQRRVTPYISTSAPITNTRAGVNVRISLAQ